jgi:Large polyvalent protein-associated domain 7
MNTIEFNGPEQLLERADALRERLAGLDWRTDGKGLNDAVDELRGIASQNWYLAANVWRDSGTQAPEPDFIDATTEVAFELRRQAAGRGLHHEIESEPSEPKLRAFDHDTLRAAANEPDAKDAAHEPQKPVSDTLEEVDLTRVKAARQADRAKAEALLRDIAQRADAVRQQPDQKAERQAAIHPAGRDNEVNAAPVFSKSGYTVPKRVTAQYVAHDGKFLDRKSETVHFEDRGKWLATDSNDRKVISHMVEVAKAKNWRVLALKGTEEFRRQAWIAARVAGMETCGFSPKAQDRALLEVARQEMRISGADRVAEPVGQRHACLGERPRGHHETDAGRACTRSPGRSTHNCRDASHRYVGRTRTQGMGGRRASRLADSRI